LLLFYAGVVLGAVQYS